VGALVGQNLLAMLTLPSEVICVKPIRSKYPKLNERLPARCPEPGATYKAIGIVYRLDTLGTVGLVLEGLPCPSVDYPSPNIKPGEEIGWWSVNFTNPEGSPVDVLTEQEREERKVAERYFALKHRQDQQREIDDLKENP
jgi:hypothetical protein